MRARWPEPITVSRLFAERELRYLVTGGFLILKRIIEVVLSVCLIAAFCGSVTNAQPRDDRYRMFGREALDRIRGDLGRAERNLRYISEPEMRRFYAIRDRLGNFQRNWERGRYDRGDLDATIGNLNVLVDRGHLHRVDRDILADDLSRLRDLRARMDRRL